MLATWNDLVIHGNAYLGYSDNGFQRIDPNTVTWSPVAKSYLTETDLLRAMDRIEKGR